MEVYSDNVIENFYIAVTGWNLLLGTGTHLDKETSFLTS